MTPAQERRLAALAPTLQLAALALAPGVLARAGAVSVRAIARAVSGENAAAFASQAIGGLGAGLVTFLAPFAGPLAIYLIWRRRSALVAFHSLQAIYWQLLCNLGAWIVEAAALACVLAFEPSWLWVAPAALALVLVYAANLAFAYRATINTWSGRDEDLPFVGRLARSITLGLPRAAP